MVLYLEAEQQAARKLVEEKKTADDLSGLAVPAPFDTWAYGGIFFPADASL